MWLIEVGVFLAMPLVRKLHSMRVSFFSSSFSALIPTAKKAKSSDLKIDHEGESQLPTPPPTASGAPLKGAVLAPLDAESVGVFIHCGNSFL